MADKINKSDAQWQAELTPGQYSICRLHGTEPAFTGKYYNCEAAGAYHCACCGLALFSSNEKFNSGTGWPSYWQPISENAIETSEDRSHGIVRTEVHCSRCDAHLGHVFPDGPPPTGLRYCINSLSLDFSQDEEQKK